VTFKGSRFRVLISGLALLCLGLQGLIIALLLDTRSTVRPLVDRSDDLIELADRGPYLQEGMVDALLLLAADQLEDLATRRIRYTLPVSHTIQIATRLAVNERILVPVSLVVNETLPIDAEIALQEHVDVPVNLQIDQVIPVDIVVPFSEQVDVPIDEIIRIDERFTIRVLGQDVEVPIQGNIPIKLDVRVPIDKQIPIRADIPVAFPISETLPVEMDWTIPIDLDVPIHLPIETTVTVPLSRAIPIDLAVPIVLDVPIDVAVDETPLGDYLRDLSAWLRQIAAQ